MDLGNIAMMGVENMTFQTKRLKATALGALMLATAPMAANALSISVQTFSATAFDNVIDSFVSHDTEDFEGPGATVCSGSAECQVGTSLNPTLVGDFSTLGDTGTGNTVVGDGTQLALKSTGSPVPGGRSNTTAGGAWWLDSNDTTGINWDVARAGGATFDRIAFSLSDAADVGATLTVSANGTTLESFVNQQNATVDLVVIDFDSLIAGATIELRNNRTNDGFGIDDATVGAIPIPAAGLMLLTALGGLGGVGALRRRRKAA